MSKSSPRRLAQSVNVVLLDGHMILIAQETDTFDSDALGTQRSILRAIQGNVYIHMDKWGGPAELTIEMWDGEPPPSSETWDHTADNEWTAIPGLTYLTGGPPDGLQILMLPTLDLIEPRRYALRAHARALANGHDEQSKEIDEWALLQIWPA